MAEENLKQFKDDICRHFDVVAERLEDKIETVGEQVGVSTEKIETLSEQVGVNTEKIETLSEQVGVNTEKITALQDDVSKIKDDIEVIKLDIEFIKNDLKQKVSHDEFAALEKRVSLMEIKFNKIS